ncbi:MAG TPA: PHB depolymerase family esterase [Baekduia sp.]
MKRIAVSLAAVVLLGVAAWATGAFATKYAASPARTPCTVLTPGDHQVQVPGEDGKLRDVLLHVPRTGAYDPLPLVIALHGAGETGPDFADDTGFSKLADREKFLVAYPTAVGPTSFWDITGQKQADLPEEVEELERSLDALEGVACVNRSRVFVTGVSKAAG